MGLGLPFQGGVADRRATRDLNFPASFRRQHNWETGGGGGGGAGSRSANQEKEGCAGGELALSIGCIVVHWIRVGKKVEEGKRGSGRSGQQG